MYIRVIRGREQIGGNIIEVGTDKTRLIFDVGTNLPPLDNKMSKDMISVEGLTNDKSCYDAVFISHHHNDHCGLLSRINSDIPVYCGKETSEIIKIIKDFTNDTTETKFNIFYDKKAVTINDITVTPILTKHSAKDAYMFYIEADGKSILYSGDFKDYSNTKTFLADKHVNALITEGTNINTEEKNYSTAITTEDDITQETIKICNVYDGTVFVLCSSTNYDRITAIQKATKECGRSYYEDLFLGALDKDNCDYKYTTYFQSDDSETKKYFNEFNQIKKVISISSMAKYDCKKLIFVRQSMIYFIKKYLNCLSDKEKEKKNVLIYSIWNGYKQSNYTTKFLNEIKGLGIDVIDLHCSGHAYYNKLVDFIKDINADTVIPIHCEKNDRNMFNNISKSVCLIGDDDLFLVN